MRIHLTLRRKVHIGVGIITLASIAFMLVIFREMTTARLTLQRITTIEQPLTHVVYEMKINANEIGSGVLAYMDTGKSFHWEVVIKNSQEFTQFHADYARFAKSPEHDAMVLSSAALFHQYLNLGQSLMVSKDQQEALTSTLIERFGQISKMPQQALPLKVGRVELTRTSVAFNAIYGENTEAVTLLTGHLHARRMDHLTRIFPFTSEGHNTLAVLEKSDNAAVRRTLSKIATESDRTGYLTHDLIALNVKMHRDIVKFRDLRRQLDVLFDYHIQVLYAKGLAFASNDANRSLGRITLVNSAALLISLMFSITSALMMLKVTQRPIKALKERTAEIVAGGLCHRLTVRSGDDFSNLTQYFNHIIDQLEFTTVSKDKLEQVNLALRKEILVRKSMQKALGKLSRKLIETQENERRHIARELHDHIGQTLTALKINLESLKFASVQTTLPFEDSLALVVETLTQVRSLSLNLRPPLLDDLGLVPALRWHLDQQAQRGGFTIEFSASYIGPRPHRDVENTCFRIAQEAITNLSRHAQARHVQVALKQADENLELIVCDDGLGFDVAAARQAAMQGASLGLLGMEERAILVGGHIRIASEPGKGTEIRVLLPMQTQEQSG